MFKTGDEPAITICPAANRVAEVRAHAVPLSIEGLATFGIEPNTYFDDPFIWWFEVGTGLEKESGVGNESVDGNESGDGKESGDENESSNGK